MKRLNKMARLVFSILAIICIIITIFSLKLEWLAIAFVCGSVAWLSHLDIKNPQF